MKQQEKIVEILKQYSINHHHEGIVLQQSWFDDVADDLVKLLNLHIVSIMLPIKAHHKLFGDVDIIGIRTECSSNNNKMYMVKNDGKYFWVYDYETELIGNYR